MFRISSFGFRISGLAGLLLLSLPLTGCVTKAQADARARAAFLAGQQQALQQFRQQQAQGPTVTFVGAVHNSLVSWTPDLTLVKALVAADYYGPDPTQITIVRDNQPIRIDPKQLLGGQDVPLQPRDVVEIK